MKVYAALVAVALAGWGLFFYQRNQVPAIQTVTIDKIVEKQVFVDRIVNKDVIRTETRPDGTKIVTVDKSAESTHTNEHVDETVKSRQVVVNTPLTKYSLGVSAIFDYRVPLKRDYRVELGRRLLDSPLWGTVSIDSKKDITLGIRYDF